jgi:hypothetical protein
MPLLKEYVATGAPVAALFSNIAQNHGVMWGALKGSLALLVRRFVNIVRIWRTETLDELYKVNEENQESIDNITRKYQDIFDKSDAMHNQQFGALSFVMHPGAAMAKTLLYSPIKNMTKEETQQFMRKEFLGLDTFDSLKPFIQPSKDVSPDPYTTAQFDADGKYTGKMTTTYLKPNPDFNPLINRAIEAVGKIFGESKVSRLSLVREATAPQEMEGIQYVIDLFQESGAFDQIMTTGEKLIDEREKQISELLGSAPQTIEYLAKIISSEVPCRA